MSTVYRTEDLRKRARDIIGQMGSQAAFSRASGVAECYVSRFVLGVQGPSRALMQFLGFEFAPKLGGYVETSPGSSERAIVMLNESLARENAKLTADNKRLRAEITMLRQRLGESDGRADTPDHKLLARAVAICGGVSEFAVRHGYERTYLINVYRGHQPITRTIVANARKVVANADKEAA